MKAARMHARGGPENLVVEDVPVPAPGPGEVRIRVAAAAITPGELGWDLTYLHADGTPRLPSIPGHDVAGRVDAVGPDVSELAVGDAVYALVGFPRDGSAAEQVIVPARDVALAPRSIPATEAAAMPLSALTAWQALFDHGRLAPGQRVLILGGTGGVGSLAVQLARWCGAHVVATGGSAHRARLLALGAHEALDRAAPIARSSEFDVVMDTVGGGAATEALASLKPRGRAITITAPQPGWSFFVVRPDRNQLARIAAVIDAGRLRAVVQAVYPLIEAPAAFARSLARGLTGKLVLAVGS